jgi:hypothetical protein
MRDNYDFGNMKGRKNPFTKRLKQPVTMRLDRDTVGYFKRMAEETGVPYQSLINLYLRDCAINERRLQMQWVPDAEKLQSAKLPSAKRQKPQ